jgi:nitroimidazol reductase NimA-like FMN-containing flavoprotein (pyridoxamine 5'-phosphate oxidase superfamily)
MELDRNGLEILDREECLRLLDHAVLGRIGISSGALPTILPVNFRLVNERIVFRTGRGTKLDAATENAVVAFEVDDLDAMGHSGWSVVVIGMAHEVRDLEERTALEEIPIPRWAPNEDGRVVSVSTDIVSGRRLRGGVPPTQPWAHPPGADHG